MRRAAPGTQVGQGRLRVDAARAIKKLREYQLADRAAWVLEGIRAAVAAGATQIVLDGDANDIWLGWHGAPWEPELLPRLFDELVSPEVSDDKQAVRLLAVAVNSALGMNPAFVDVYAITAPGTAKRARYTPEVLAEPENELGEALLRHVATDDHEPPGAIGKGMLVHLRRRASLSLLSYWIGEPPELPLARAACRDIGVPLVIDNEKALQRDGRRDLLRVPLEDGLDGFVAITHEPVEPSTCFEVAERGVVLARYELQVLGYDAKVPLPIRVFVDAQRLPTNASRSQVRRDVHPIATAERRARTVIGSAIAKLATLVTDAPADIAQQARRAAFSLLASAVGGHPAGWNYIPAVLAPLERLPLVRNAFGQPRALTAAWASNIHGGPQPLDAELDRWIGEVLWAPPEDPVRILLAGFMIDVTAMRRQLRWARQQHRAYKRFLAHNKRDLKVQTATRPRVRVSIGVMVEQSCVPQDAFGTIKGEVCLYTTSRNAAVVLCVDGRELERLEMTSAIAFDAVVDSSALTPGERYRRVQRDSGFAAVQTQLRAGVLRAVEWLVGEGDITDADMPLVRSALALAKELGYTPRGPLARAPAWRTVGGAAASYDDLKTCKYIGVIAEGQTLVPPAGRVIVHASFDAREELRQLFGLRLVSYHKAAEAKRIDALTLAGRMPRASGAACLIVRGSELPGVIAAIAVSTGKPTLYLHHCGVPLAEREYKWSLVRTSVAIDADQIMPNDKWTGLLDDAGLATAPQRDWEEALVRAIAAKLVGDDVPDLVAPGTIAVGDINFTLLAEVLTNHDARTILGDALYDRLCEYPLFRRVGEHVPVSVRALAAANPNTVFCVGDASLQPVDDFAPVIANEQMAKLIAKLAQRTVQDGKPELVRRARSALRAARIAEHLAKPEQPTQLASEIPTASFRGEIVRGVVGFVDGTPVVHVHVESRPFRTVALDVGYPIAAVVDLALDRCSETFDGISNQTLHEIAEDLRGAVPALLAQIADTQPRLLGEPGPARRALWTLLQSGQITNALRDALRKAPAFVTVQGAHASIEDAEGKDGYLPVAAYADEWLPADEHEQPDLQDKPILRVARPIDELHWIIGKLHMDAVTDVTAGVNRLQGRRRMARGLLPTPRLPGVPDELKRPLQSLGEQAKRLGHGEVGFAMSSVATLLVHEQGQLQRTLDIDVMPAIQLAIEAPHELLDHAEMIRVAQDLALELVRVALPRELPVPLRRNLARAVLSRRVPPAAVDGAPLFQRVDGTWIDWPAFAAQLDRFDDVWALTTGLQQWEPLDPERIVIVLDAADIELAVDNGYKVINAVVELGHDATARANMARPKAWTLELPSREGVLAEVELEGNGTTSPRGTVAVLVPQAASRRGMYAHRGMHPFDRSDDVCRWPTISVLDDARIEPNRTWTAPKGNDTWGAITKAVRAASEGALAQVGDVPGEALAELRVTAHVCSDVKALREAPRTMIRGVLWLGGVPYTPNTVVVRDASGVRSFVPANGLAVGGSLAIFTEDELDVGAALEQLCRICHGKLARMLLKDDELDRDVASAHIAHAIAEATVKPTEVKGITFACFAPSPLQPRKLASLFRGSESVPIVKKGVTDIAEIAFVDDGSETAKVVRSHLGERLTNAAPLPKPAPPPKPPKPPVSTVRPAPPPPQAARPKPADRPKAPPPKPHVLQPLVDALSARVAQLGIQTVRWVISERSDEPMFEHAKFELVVAGASKRLRAVAAELAADSVRAEPAIDALAAHVVTVLNIARTDITDASEMHALGVLLSSSPPSAGRPRSRRSS